jgi:hypothetical protein
MLGSIKRTVIYISGILQTAVGITLGRLLVHRAYKVLKVYKAQKAIQEPQEPQALQDLRAHRAHREYKAPQVQLVLQGLLDHKAFRVNKALLDHKVLRHHLHLM